MLTSKDYAANLRKTIDPNKASKSAGRTSFTWPTESSETTHLSIVDADAQRRLAHLHAGGRLRLAHRGARAPGSC